MTTNLIAGGCLCGRVRYQAKGRPSHITHCHCADCRRTSAAPFVTWASFPYDSFQLLKGEPKLITWADRLRSFCAHCGTPLTFMDGPDADEIDVTVCSFDHPETVTPQDHTWTEDQLPWIQPGDKLPRHKQARE